jgi:hypothetical protein
MSDVDIRLPRTVTHFAPIWVKAQAFVSLYF